MRRHRVESTEARRAVTLAAFRALAADTGEEIRSLVDLYLECTAEALDRLSAAIAAQSVEESARAAHSCAGSSLLCGMQRLGLLFERIEEASRARQFDAASTLCCRARAEFAAVQTILLEHGESTEGP